MNKVYIAIKYHENYNNKNIVDSIEEVLNEHGFAGVCIIRDFEKKNNNNYDPKYLMKLTFNEIDESNFIIIDFSEKGVGLGIEAGYAFANKKGIIVIAKENSEISNTLLGVSDVIIYYTDSSKIKEVLGPYLNTIKNNF